MSQTLYSRVQRIDLNALARLILSVVCGGKVLKIQLYPSFVRGSFKVATEKQTQSQTEYYGYSRQYQMILRIKEQYAISILVTSR